MDSKLLSTVLMSGNTATQPPSLHSASRPSAFPPSLHSTAEDLTPSPSSSASSQMTASETALNEAIDELPPFNPYSAQVPWHTGVRAFFSQIFPKYGHYCGPNWSSGRSSGSLFWDKPPVDWLDYCCLCHDIGYDTHDQAKLYKADLELLECLQKMPPSNSNARHGNKLSKQGHNYGNGAVAGFYRNLYMTGLQTFLLPYRRMLIRDRVETTRKE